MKKTAIQTLIEDLKKEGYQMDNLDVHYYLELEKVQKWNNFLENNFPLNDWNIVVFSNKKNKYYIEYTDSEFYQRCINRNYIKWMKL
jgi:hypothetical protein